MLGLDPLSESELDRTKALLESVAPKALLEWDKTSAGPEVAVDGESSGKRSFKWVRF